MYRNTSSYILSGYFLLCLSLAGMPSVLPIKHAFSKHCLLIACPTDPTCLINCSISLLVLDVGGPWLYLAFFSETSFQFVSNVLTVLLEIVHVSCPCKRTDQMWCLTNQFSVHVADFLVTTTQTDFQSSDPLPNFPSINMSRIICRSSVWYHCCVNHVS